MTSGDPQSQAADGNGLTYRAAGVDIDAGDALVRADQAAGARHRRGPACWAASAASARCST